MYYIVSLMYKTQGTVPVVSIFVSGYGTFTWRLPGTDIKSYVLPCHCMEQHLADYTVKRVGQCKLEQYPCAVGVSESTGTTRLSPG